MYKINTLLIPVLLALLTACSSSPQTEVPDDIAELDNLTVIPADVNPSNNIDFKKDAVYGDSEDVMLGSIADMTVDEKGRVFIADRDQNYIHVFNPDGDYLRQVGSEGEGPGEFAGISRVKANDKYLYGYDWNKREVNLFELESLAFSNTIPLLRDDLDVEALSGKYPGEYYLANDENMLVSYRDSPPRASEDNEEKRTSLYYRVNQEGNITSDKIFEHGLTKTLVSQAGGGMILMRPDYARRTLLSVVEDGRIFTAWTEDFLVKIHGSDGSYKRAIYYPYTKADLNVSEVVNEYDSKPTRQLIRSDDPPSTWPALNSLMIDDENRIWVSTITDDQEVNDWWVISEEGELLARFTWPRSRSVEKIKNGAVYTEETDEESGLEQVVKYNIELS